MLGKDILYIGVDDFYVQNVHCNSGITNDKLKATNNLATWMMNFHCIIFRRELPAPRESSMEEEMHVNPSIKKFVFLT